MSVDPEFRVLIAYLLVMRWGVVEFYRRTRPQGGLNLLRAGCDARTQRLRQVAWWLGCVALVAYSVCGDFLSQDELGLPVFARWLAAVPAVAAILSIAWSLDRASHADQGLERKEQLRHLLQRRPYCVVRHPLELADGALLLCLAVMSNQMWVALLTSASVGWLYGWVVPRQDVALAHGLGNDCSGCFQRSGRLLPRWPPWPRLPTPRAAQYHVPSRFGLTAILALMTILSLTFGLMNQLRYYIEIPAAVYLFLAGQMVMVCIGQMLFGSAPRMISILSGMFLLPLFVFLSVRFPASLGAWKLVLLLFCMLAGAVLGYCTGTLAAGFFLVMDWVEATLAKRQQR